MQATSPRRWLKAAIGLTATVALCASGALTATNAQAASTPIDGTPTVAVSASQVAAYQDLSVTVNFRGCYTYGDVEEQINGVWDTVNSGYYRAGAIASGDCATDQNSGTFSLYEAMGIYSSNSLAPGTHTYRLHAKTWSEKHTDGTYWSISEAYSQPFTITVVPAQTTISGWTAKTITVKPGGAYTLPGIVITNPGTDNVVYSEYNYGFGWICANRHYVDGSYTTQDCGQATYSNDTLTQAAVKDDPKGKWAQTIQYRYRVAGSQYVTGAVSPIITVKFTKGVKKAKSVKVTAKVSKNAVEGKTAGTVKATLSNKKATGVVGFTLYAKYANGYYEVYSPMTGPKPKKGKATYKYTATKNAALFPAGTYYLVAAFQSTSPTKYKWAVSKAVKFTVK
ncbi:MAG: hypothetical protein LBR32_02375 [Propionibacteriaceae bacterium]|jgi:hypothetical protein|nr:hypothetical protein [Propionibacteriaceae bacterium]